MYPSQDNRTNGKETANKTAISIAKKNKADFLLLE